MKHIIILGIGSLTAVITAVLVAYLRRLKNKIKSFILERDKIAKYLQEED